MSKHLADGIANLIKHNITTGLELEEYVCEGKINGALKDDDEPHEFVPFCEWPYMFKGWGEDGVPGNNDTVVFEDGAYAACTQTNGESYASAYLVKRLVYIILNVITIVWCCRYLVHFRTKRMASKNKNVTTSETLCKMNLTICVAHLLISLDPDSTGFFPVLFLSMLQGYNGAAMISLAFLLVNSWVTIIDGGKSKKTPPWMDKLTKFSVPCAIFCEVVLAIVEIQVTPAGTGSYDGTVNAVKGFA
eukprot:CAMPEP_0118657026 /NCGR_PEP_ID=MMETSP0785-20121206/13793_1 /TAXON_ID=91992 /ORGANISM="Bolidomonas pacifica, Strain CCMP 1866" /LENGTH=246 /DNA_ID=CAMNT_0006549905 /DNA_START=34 /DNA_END=774 /DNA_ORIENTATION=+